jgi:hypothetical protein
MPAAALYVIASSNRPSIWAPAAVIGAHHAWRRVQEQGGKASFSLDAATLDACPLRIRFRAFDLRPCGSALLGRLGARGTDTSNPSVENGRPFLALGGGALVTANLGPFLTLSGRVTAGANLVRDSFEFKPTTFYTVPLITETVSIGLGVRWE